MTSTAAALVEKPLRDSAIAAAIATVALGGALIAYAIWSPVRVPSDFAEAARSRMLTGAVGATFSMIPGLLFLVRAIQWWRRRGPHPSISLALLAAVALYPLIFCLLIVFIH